MDTKRYVRSRQYGGRIRLLERGIGSSIHVSSSISIHASNGRLHFGCRWFTDKVVRRQRTRIDAIRRAHSLNIETCCTAQVDYLLASRLSSGVSTIVAFCLTIRKTRIWRIVRRSMRYKNLWFGMTPMSVRQKTGLVHQALHHSNYKSKCYYSRRPWSHLWSSGGSKQFLHQPWRRQLQPNNLRSSC